MKPLSNFLYIKRNKGKTFTGMISIIIAIQFLISIYAIMGNIVRIQNRNYSAAYKNSYTLESLSKPFDDETVNEMRSNDAVDKALGVFTFRTIYQTIGIRDSATIYVVKASELNYIMDKLKLKIATGNSPGADVDEIILNKDIAKNKGLKIGDYIGSEVDNNEYLPGKFKIVGLIEGESFTSFIVKEDIKGFNNMIIFPKENKGGAVDSYLKSFSVEDYSYTNKAIVDKRFKDTSQILTVVDIIAILYVFIVVFTTSTAKYVQFFMRKEEIGILNAIGFNKEAILKRAFKEVLAINIIAYGLGIILGVGVNYLFNIMMWEKDGFVSNLISLKGVVVAMFVPMFATLATIVPINNIINKVDPINIVEKN